MISSGKYWSEAMDTLAASRWTLIMARIFGKKFVGHDSGCTITMYRYRGKAYMTDFKEKEECTCPPD
jgi:hypothetical protein